MSQSDWDTILDEDETIIWQGRPVGGMRMKPKHVFTLLFGMAFAGFALVWMILASKAGGVFWMFGLIHFTAGICVMAGPIVWPAIMAKRTWYTLTNKRGIIASVNLFKQKSLKTYPITTTTALQYTTLSDTTGSVHFAREQRRGNKGRRYDVDIGFEDIPDAASVHRMLRDIQKAAS